MLNFNMAQSYEHICPCNCYTVLYILSSNRVIILLTIQLTSFFLTKPIFACISRMSFLAHFCDGRKSPEVTGFRAQDDVHRELAANVRRVNPCFMTYYAMAVNTQNFYCICSFFRLSSALNCVLS